MEYEYRILEYQEGIGNKYIYYFIPQVRKFKFFWFNVDMFLIEHGILFYTHRFNTKEKAIEAIKKYKKDKQFKKNNRFTGRKVLNIQYVEGDW